MSVSVRALLAGLLLVGAVAGVTYVTALTGKGAAPATEWQAVFLSSDQVYFGHVRYVGDLVELSEVYYLRSQQAPAGAPAAGSPGPQMALVKLGGEMHGPTDRMLIPMTSVLFIEDLRDDSDVVRAIRGQRTK